MKERPSLQEVSTLAGRASSVGEVYTAAMGYKDQLRFVYAAAVVGVYRPARTLTKSADETERARGVVGMKLFAEIMRGLKDSCKSRDRGLALLCRHSFATGCGMAGNVELQVGSNRGLWRHLEKPVDGVNATDQEYVKGKVKTALLENDYVEFVKMAGITEAELKAYVAHMFEGCSPDAPGRAVWLALELLRTGGDEGRAAAKELFIRACHEAKSFGKSDQIQDAKATYFKEFGGEPKTIAPCEGCGPDAFALFYEDTGLMMCDEGHRFDPPATS